MIFFLALILVIFVFLVFLTIMYYRNNEIKIDEPDVDPFNPNKKYI